MPVGPGCRIADTARVHPDAILGADVVVGDYCVIESDVVVGDRCAFEPHVYIKRWTTLGKGNRVSAGTALGTDPLDKKFGGERSYLVIGDENTIREHYTISRGTEPESTTTIGNGNYIMTSGHIAHNSLIGNETTICSCALVAGHVQIDDQAFISGGVVIHQFSRIGRLAMIGGNTRVNKDAPPFFLYSGFDITPQGVNVVGLTRAGVTSEDIREIKRAYRLLYRSGRSSRAAAAEIEASLSGDHVGEIVRFVRESHRGIAPSQRRRATG